VVADWASRMQEDEREVEESDVTDVNLSMLCLVGEEEAQEIAVPEPNWRTQDFV